MSHLPAPLPRSPKRVLILEPDHWVFRAAAVRLTAMGHSVVKVSSADAAIAALRSGAEVAIVAGHACVALAARLRAAGCAQPIVLVTGPGYLQAMREAFEAGMHDLLARAVRSLDALPRVIDRISAQLDDERAQPAARPEAPSPARRTLARAGLVAMAALAATACSARTPMPMQPAIEVIPLSGPIASASPAPGGAPSAGQPSSATFRPWGLPLRLRWSEPPAPAVEAAMRHAVRTWNEGLGEEVATLQPGGLGQPVALGVLREAARGDDGALVVGVATEGGPGEVWRIDLFERLAAELLPGAAVHELGHLLGLGHNHADTSVMFWRTTGLTEPSPEDVRLARTQLGRLKAAPPIPGWRPYTRSSTIAMPCPPPMQAEATP